MRGGKRVSEGWTNHKFISERPCAAQSRDLVVVILILYDVAYCVCVSSLEHFVCLDRSSALTPYWLEFLFWLYMCFNVIAIEFYNRVFFFYCTIVFGSVSSVFHHRCLFVILKRLHVNSVSSFKCLVQPIYTSGQDTVVVL